MARHSAITLIRRKNDIRRIALAVGSKECPRYCDFDMPPTLYLLLGQLPILQSPCEIHSVLTVIGID